AYVEYNGLAFDYSEGERLARAMGSKSVLILRNHGALVIGASVAQAFERLYFLERACQSQILALSSGRKLHILPQSVIEATAAHLIQDEIGLSPRQLGLLFSAFFWSYSLLQIPVGWVAERYGAQRVLAAGLAIWACATMLVGVAHSFAALLALRVLLGIGESAGFPSVSKLLTLVVPVRDLGTANGIVAFAYLFGPAVGAYCGGLIMLEFGWRAAFWV